MKMKKICLLFSMITVLFSLTACSDGQGKVNFTYTDTDITYSSVVLTYNLLSMDDANKAYITAEGEEVYQTALSNFETTVEECGSFKGYRSKEDGSSIMIDLANLDTTNEEDVANLTQFLSLIDTKIEEDGDTVSVTLTAVFDERNAEIKFVYVKDSAYEYGGSNTPFKPSEITASPEYTFGEKMEKAAANTLMGMGTVFIVLIFISIIIAQFENIAKLGRKKQEVSTEGVPAVAVEPFNKQNLMDDGELAAVITAAIMEAEGAGGGSDNLVVRSIRKAKR